MKLISTILFIFFTCQPSYSQKDENKELETEKEIKDDVINQLFSSREKTAFTNATNKAKKIGLNKQVILEATFLYHVDLSEFAKIIELIEEFKNMQDSFDPKESKIFIAKEDWLSVIEYGLALKALNEKNIPLFKKHIKEAFWLSPDKAGAFAPHVNQLHTRNAMAKIKVDMGHKIFQITNGKNVSIKKLLEEKEALVLRFWSPWSQKIEANYPKTKKLAEECLKNKINFASILINKDEQGIKDTLEIIKETGNDFPSLWLADEDNSELSKLLRITDLPSIIVISNEGSILYNGTLENKELWATLSIITNKAKSKK